MDNVDNTHFIKRYTTSAALMNYLILTQRYARCSILEGYWLNLALPLLINATQRCATERHTTLGNATQRFAMPHNASQCHATTNHCCVVEAWVRTSQCVIVLVEKVNMIYIFYNKYIKQGVHDDAQENAFFWAYLRCFSCVNENDIDRINMKLPANYRLW